MDDKSERVHNLRRKAEGRLAEGGSSVQSVMDADIQALVHELHVHQIELEMQNEELRRAMEEAEAASRRYSDLYNHAPVGYVTIDENSVVVEANLTAADLLGVARCDLVNASFMPFLAPDSYQDYQSCCGHAVSAETRISREMVLLKNRKDPFYALVEAVSEGGPAHWRVTITDISERKRAEDALRRAYDELEDMVEERTRDLQQANQSLQNEIRERKRAEQSLRESEGRFRALMMASSEVLYRMSPDWSEMLSLYSRGFLSDTDRPTSHWLLKYIHPDDQSQVTAAISEAIRTKGVFELEHRVRRADGSFGWTFSRAVPMMDESGEIVEWFGAANDISERKAAEDRKEEVLHREQHIAEVLQKALLPTTEYDIPNCEIAVKYVPALKEAEVGGDFYDVFMLEDGRVGIVIGDVMGKGLLSAIGVAAAKHSVRSYAYIDPRPGRTMTLANDALCKGQPGEPEDSMLTAFFMVLDTRFGGIAYANGGHEPPVLRKADGNVERLPVSGRALGVENGYEYQEAGQRLQPGDVVVMVTDGISEAHQDRRMLFGMEGVEHYVAEHPTASPQEIVDGLLEAAKDFAGGQLSDDVAIVAMSLKNGTE